MGAQIAEWVLTIVVVVGVIASIPMLPIVLVGLAIIAIRSPVAGFGIADQVTPDSGSDRLLGFPGRYVFPFVATGWLLIGLAIGVVISGGAGGGRSSFGFLVGMVVFLGATFAVYRSMHPPMRRLPFDEWLGGLRPSPGVTIVLVWMATVGLLAVIDTWTASVGGLWSQIVFLGSMLALFAVPLLLLLIRPRAGPRLYLFLGAVTVLVLATALASAAGITPARPLP